MRCWMVILALGCEHGFVDPTRATAPAPSGEPTVERIHRPAALGALDTTLTQADGAPVGVACETCHSAGTGPAIADRLGDPETFHTAVRLQHGGLACDACHDPQDRTRLRLADGTRLDLADAMALCSQCHGPQRRDYDHGAHGGMTGAWDLRQGARTRNHCLDCHASHAPQFGTYTPVFPPKDRMSGADHE